MKYIDAEKLKEEIESISLIPQTSADYNDGRDDMKMMLLNIIDSLQQEKPAEWSKEDDNHLHSIYHYLRILKDESDNDSVKKNIEEHINWLSKQYQIFLASHFQ